MASDIEQIGMHLHRFLAELRVGDAPCLEFEDRTYTTDEVRRAVADWSEALVAAGVGRGDVVALQVPNGPRTIVGLHACWEVGAVGAPVSPLLPRGELESVVERLRPGFLIVEAADADLGLKRPPEPGRWAGDAVPRPEAALVLHTSGTTGSPKPVFLSHDAMAYGAATFAAQAAPGPAKDPAGRGRPLLIAFPLCHLAGIGNMLVGLAAGRCLLVLGRFEAERVAALVSRHRLRALSLNPTMIHMMLHCVDPAQLTTLRYVRSGSAPLSPELARRFRDRFGVPVVNSYGQTEAGGEIVGWSDEDIAAFSETKLGSIGRVRAGLGVKFFDEDGREVPPGAVGELSALLPAARAPSLADGGRLTKDGYLRTGDLGYVDDDGFLWLVGRTSDVIVCGGFKVMPEEVERTLERCPGVAEAMVVGMDDDRLGEVPVAYVVPDRQPPPPGLGDQIVGWSREHLARYKAPRRVEFVTALPRTELGKLRRRAR